MPVETYDAIVIGAGQAGGPLSTALARAGRTTALIEREHVGGTCINEGCTPTKTMVASITVGAPTKTTGAPAIFRKSTSEPSSPVCTATRTEASKTIDYSL